MLKTVIPLERGCVKMGLPLSSRVAEPVGVPVVVLTTVAVRATGEPTVALAVKLLIVTTVGAGLIVTMAVIGSRV